MPLAPGVPERLIVGQDRAFLIWFYDGATAVRSSVSEAPVEETLRSFSGSEGVLGALGVYRAAFTTMEQTMPLKKNKVRPPVLAIAGDKGMGSQVAEMVEAVASNLTSRIIADCGHFVPVEQPAELVRLVKKFEAKLR